MSHAAESGRVTEADFAWDTADVAWAVILLVAHACRGSVLFVPTAAVVFPCHLV
jgi:hypothetical protein